MAKTTHNYSKENVSRKRLSVSKVIKNILITCDVRSQIILQLIKMNVEKHEYFKSREQSNTCFNKLKKCQTCEVWFPSQK